MPMENRIALVTGASRGIGRAIALRLAREGAAVAVNYVRGEAAAGAVVDEILGAGGKAVALRADIGDLEAARGLVGRVEEELGPLDILVNNAGILLKGDLDDFDLERMEAMRRVNVDGLTEVTRAAAAGMRQRRYGRIVNLSSIAAHGTSVASTTFYAATKAAVMALTRRFAMDLGPHGITVNAIAPGYVITDMVVAGLSAEEAESAAGRAARKAMMRRAGRPEDIAHAVAFLVAPEAGFITAQTITVDGGRMDYAGHP